LALLKVYFTSKGSHQGWSTGGAGTAYHSRAPAIVNKGQKEKKTNNGQQRTKREKDKQCSTQKWTENN
jgi:hypothetical protein